MLYKSIPVVVDGLLHLKKTDMYPQWQKETEMPLIVRQLHILQLLTVQMSLQELCLSYEMKFDCIHESKFKASTSNHNIIEKDYFSVGNILVDVINTGPICYSPTSNLSLWQMILVTSYCEESGKHVIQNSMFVNLIGKTQISFCRPASCTTENTTL